MPEIGSIFENKYKLLETLGHGGFAGAYLGENINTKEKVVIKIPDISKLGDPAVYERFKREMSIGKLLDHPDLPATLEFSEGLTPYIIMKFMEGELLSNILKEKGKFPVKQTIELISNLLDALDYCHQKGVYHRDLKPENLILSTDGHLKILDFGIAMMEGSPRVTWRGFSGLMGTPEYMSPEQIKGERGEARSDIYAVGCLLYNMLSGNPPYEGDNPLTVMYQHLTGELKPLTSKVADMPKELWAVIKHSLRRRKDERYSTAHEMAEELRHPEKVDLKWINEPDPVLTTILPSKNNHWMVIGISILAGIILAFLFIFFRK